MPAELSCSNCGAPLSSPGSRCERCDGGEEGAWNMALPPTGAEGMGQPDDPPPVESTVVDNSAGEVSPTLDEAAGGSEEDSPGTRPPQKEPTTEELSMDATTASEPTPESLEVDSTTASGPTDSSGAGSPPAGRAGETAVSDVTPENAGPGDLISGKFRILAQLGKGSFGTVYRVEDTLLGRHFALKVLHTHLATGAQIRDRFLQEIDVMLSLMHDNIVPLRDFGQLGPSLYFTMDLIEGRSLLDIMRELKGPMELDRALRLTQQLLSGLELAHSKGVVHRDLKPENLLVENGGEEDEKLRIADFGVAHVFRDVTGGVELTQGGQMIGTPAYMSPEQWKAEEVTNRSDLYAVGIIFYELISGKRPFKAKTQAEFMDQHLHGMPRPLQEFQLEPKIPEAIEVVMLRCMAKAPEERPENATDLKGELEEALAVNSKTALKNFLRKFPRPTFEDASKLAPIAIVAALLLLIAGLIYTNGGIGKRDNGILVEPKRAGFGSLLMSSAGAWREIEETAANIVNDDQLALKVTLANIPEGEEMSTWPVALTRNGEVVTQQIPDAEGNVSFNINPALGIESWGISVAHDSENSFKRSFSIRRDPSLGADLELPARVDDSAGVNNVYITNGKEFTITGGIPGGEAPAGELFLYGASGTEFIPVAIGADGSFSKTVSIEDSALRNDGSLQLNWYFPNQDTKLDGQELQLKVDRVGPDITISEPGSGPRKGFDLTIKATINDPNLGKDPEIVAMLTSSVSGDATTANAELGRDGRIELSMPLPPGAVDTECELTLIAKDLAGNDGKEIVAFRVDRLAPTLEASEFKEEGDKLLVSGTASEPLQNALIDGSTISIDGANWKAERASSEGKNVLELVMVDLLGNESVPVKLEYNRDSSGPQAIKAQFLAGADGLAIFELEADEEIASATAICVGEDLAIQLQETAEGQGRKLLVSMPYSLDDLRNQSWTPTKSPIAITLTDTTGNANTSWYVALPRLSSNVVEALYGRPLENYEGVYLFEQADGSGGMYCPQVSEFVSDHGEGDRGGWKDVWISANENICSMCAWPKP